MVDASKRWKLGFGSEDVGESWHPYVSMNILGAVVLLPGGKQLAVNCLSLALDNAASMARVVLRRFLANYLPDTVRKLSFWFDKGGHYCCYEACFFVSRSVSMALASAAWRATFTTLQTTSAKRRAAW